jgi:hypothetical protein
MDEKVVHGKFNIKKRVIDEIVSGPAGWYAKGHSEMDFGFKHSWVVGPYKTAQEAQDDFNANNR